MDKKVLLSISNISLAAKDTNKIILSDISYQVCSGDFVIILGGNGSGKSSLLKTLTQTYKQSDGSISFEDKRLCDLSSKQRARDIAIVAQDSNDSLFHGFTVIENCLMYDSINKNNYFKISQTQERLYYKNYLLPFSVDLANNLDTNIERLSGGQRQTLVLALCLQHNPKLLLLDEHTSALDPKAAQVVMTKTYETVVAKKITCIMTTHDLDEALLYGNRLIALKNGKIIFVAEKNQKQILTKKDLMAYCY